MTRLPVPLSVKLAEFHRSQRDWHRGIAERFGIAEHAVAATAHDAASRAPLDVATARAAMRASSLADQAAQRAGIKPEPIKARDAKTR